jgi:Tfp pilus assembly ATPase PilU
VILIGEIRSREVMDYAIAFAETGHLVLATLHANNANQALIVLFISLKVIAIISSIWISRSI